MSRVYSADLRGRVIDAVAAGGSARGAAARFGVGIATAVRWVHRWRETGERTARRQGYPGYSKLDAHEAFLLELIKDEVGASLFETGLCPPSGSDMTKVEQSEVSGRIRALFRAA